MRKILLLSLLAASACVAQAAPTSWDFSYTGLFVTRSYTSTGPEPRNDYAEGFEPDARITGSFSGEDRNGNGIIDIGELTGFQVHGRDYFPCMEAPSPYGRCGISSFSYVPGGELGFFAGWGGYDEYYSGWSGSVRSGVSARDYSYGHFYESTTSWYWTDQTRFDIVQLPVPEPASGAMAAAGLALLAGLRWRHKR
ncbi:PEP-CTERM sorting domain-containing protein [Massilia sp. BSC265]|uniref:PEP-CTERM sorting domain-containing protein n=1 Tax=Massilia sp. BSC265 TaxID=1549812 RepID=UPI000B17089C|nr:PEP-CTERM sorting domain-containing protein [Massilia sp. BSC265]